MIRREFRRSRGRLWRFSVLVLVPLLAVLVALLALLVSTASIADILGLPVGLLALAGAGIVVLPLLGAWAVAHAIARRGSADIIIDGVGIHDTRLPVTIEWANIRGIRLHSTMLGKHLRVEVADLVPVLATLSPLLRAGFEGRSEIDLQLLFFDAPQDIARAAMDQTL